MSQKHYSNHNFNPSMDFYGQHSGFASRTNGDYYNRERYEQYEHQHRVHQNKGYYGKRDLPHQIYQPEAYPNPMSKGSFEHTATYQYGGTSNPKMNTISPPSKYIHPTMMQMPFSLSNESPAGHHQSSSLFRSASPARMSPILPTLPLDDLSPNRRAAAGLLSKNMIPVPEEDEMTPHQNHGYEIENVLRHSVGIPNIHAGPSKLIPLGDPSSNYTPFGGGTYFGPTVLNKYGDTSDFFTPQAKHIRPRNHVAVPGDASAKNYNRQVKKPSKPSSQGFTAGFADLASSVIKDHDINENDEN